MLLYNQIDINSYNDTNYYLNFWIKENKMNITFLSQRTISKEDESRWYQECKRENIPMVIARTRTTRGDVTWDCITLNASEGFPDSQEKFIVQELAELLRYYAAPKVIKTIHAFCGSVKNLPIECVEDFAKDVCNTLSKAYIRHYKQKHLTDIL